MSPYFYAIGLSLIGGFGGLLVASTLLLFPDGVRVKIVPWLVSYAVGTLLGVALLALLPEALQVMPPRRVFESLLGGILLFFVLEKLVLWRHCHTNDCEVHSTGASLVLIGDAFHNFVDGAMIGAAVLTSVPLGVSTAIAVATHEVPRRSVTSPSCCMRATAAGARCCSTCSRALPRSSAPRSPCCSSTPCRRSSHTCCAWPPPASSTSRWPI